MSAFLPETQTYLIGLIGLLAIVAVIVGSQVFKTQRDERALIRLEKSGAGSSKEASKLYELASVQLRKRLYPQAIASLRKALKQLTGEPDEAKALIENALGFALAAQTDYSSAVSHYQSTTLPLLKSALSKMLRPTSCIKRFSAWIRRTRQRAKTSSDWQKHNQQTHQSPRMGKGSDK